MEILFIVIAIVLGIALILIEILFVPGTTIVGIFGFILVGAGIYYTYTSFGQEIGNYTLVGSSLVSFGLIYFGFKSSSWKFIANESVIESRVNDNINLDLKLNDEGISVSALRPMGTASFNHEYVEVSTLGNFIEANTKIKIIEIKNKQIVVQPLN